LISANVENTSMSKKTINIQGLDIRIEPINKEDYISLTDIAKRFAKNGMKSNNIIQNWIRNKDTIEFLGVWETLSNPDFKSIEFDAFKNEAGHNRFGITPSVWIEKTKAIGITSKAGRYGGTYAHKDIVLGFCYWLSPPFQVYMLKEFQRLKKDEANRQQLEWNVKKITDNVEEIRNILDTIEGQDPSRNRLKGLDE